MALETRGWLTGGEGVPSISPVSSLSFTIRLRLRFSVSLDSEAAV